MRIYIFDIVFVFLYLLMLSSYIIESSMIGWLAVGITIALSIRYFNKPKELIILQLSYIFQYQFYISRLYLPVSIAYLTDWILFLIIVNLLLDILREKQKFNKSELVIFYCLISFMVIGFFSNLVYSPSIIRYFWAIRNNARIFIFLIASIHYIDKFLLFKSERLLEITFFFNSIFVILQYYKFGYFQDFLGGIFGNEIGTSNTYLHVLLLIFCCISISKYLNKNISIVGFLYYMGLICFLAAVSELKILFVEIPIVFILSYIVSGINLKQLIRLLTILGVSVALIVRVLPILESVSPFFAGFLNIREIISISTESYTGKNDIGRLSAISYVRERFFEYDLFKTMFGIGLGNAEYSQKAILVSPFFLNHGAYSHYNWFSLPFTMVETGLVGVVFYMFSYIYLFIKFVFMKFQNYLTMISAQLAFLSIILFVYNLTLRIEIGYLFVYVLSWGFVSIKNQNQEKNCES